MSRLAGALVVAGVLLDPGVASAHGVGSAYLEVTELAAGRVVLRLATAGRAAGLVAATPAGCSDEDDGTARVFVRTLTCAEGLEGKRIEVRGIGPVVGNVVVRVAFADGATTSRVLTKDAPSFAIPRASRKALLLVDYARLGVEHIFGGWDHLLFLAALALSVRRLRAIVVAETAFTASHSLSFTASALGWVQLSPLAAEACIALSLVLAALDAAKASAEGVLVPPRRAATLAFAFGLVHGLGFAGGLAEIGMPDRAIGWALLGFAGGVEAGQLVFLVLFTGALALLARSRGRAPVELTFAYAVGSAGAFLVLERARDLLAP